jgi:death-on-curing protein
MNLEYISFDEAKAIHQRIMIKTEEGPQILRNPGGLESALERPKNVARYEGADLIRQASVLCLGISQAQAFVDGNKRTAVAVTDLFLRNAGLKIRKKALVVRKKLEKVAKEVAAKPGDANRILIETEFQNWLGQLIVRVTNKERALLNSNEEFLKIYRNEQAKYKTSYILSIALIKNLTGPEIVDNFDLKFEQDYRLRIALCNRLEAITKEDNSNMVYVRELVSKLLEIPSKPKARKLKITNSLKRVVPILPVNEQKKLAYQFIEDSNTERNQLGIKLIIANPSLEDKQILYDNGAFTQLTKANFDLTDIAAELLEYFDETEDSLSDDLFDTRYQQARIFEKLIEQDLALAERLAVQYPLAFIWGAGRTGKPEVLPIIRPFIEVYKEDYENLNLIIWTLGMLGAKEDLQKLTSITDVDIKLSLEDS